MIIGPNTCFFIDKERPIYYISLVGTDAGDLYGKGLPRKAMSFFDIFTELEFEEITGITFLSVQDLLLFYQQTTGKKGEEMNVYKLVLFFMKTNSDGLYFLDEVPLIQSLVKLRYDVLGKTFLL